MHPVRYSQSLNFPYRIVVVNPFRFRIENMASKSAASAAPTQSPASSTSAVETTSKSGKKKTPGFS